MNNYTFDNNINFIECYPHVLSHDQCNHIINTFEHDRRQVEGTVGGGLVNHAIKHSTDVHAAFSKTTYDEYNNIIRPAVIGGLQLYCGTYDYLVELAPWSIQDEYNIQKYTHGQGFGKLHCEKQALHPDRTHAWMIYLNDAESGTQFPYQKLTTTPKTGDLWIWPAYWTHVHRGVTPNKGRKFIATGWCVFDNDT